MIESLKFTWFAPDHDYEDPCFRVDQSFTLAGITVPLGFVSDLGSIPRVFRPVFSPVGRYGPAAIVHDYCLKYHKELACAKFHEALKEQKCSKAVVEVFAHGACTYIHIKKFIKRIL